ncbi:hypothetical protein [Methanosarcina siciliae]|nr:hypothetical protein [Methanosarcina siciliae]
MLFLAVPASAAEVNTIEVLEGVIGNGLNIWTGERAKELTDNKTDGGVFAAVTAPIPYATEENIKRESENTLPIFIILSKTVIIVITLFCLIQIVSPETAAEMASFFHGRATYYEPKEVLITGRNLALWFACGPGLLVLMFVICNNFLNMIDTSPLDAVTLDSDNIINFSIFGIAAKGVNVYMSIRGAMLFTVVRFWWLLGLVIAVKKTRWLGALLLWYVGVQVFAQPVVLAILVDTVGGMQAGYYGAALPDILIYAGLTIFIMLICFFSLTAPVWVRIFSPSTIRTVIAYAKYI